MSSVHDGHAGVANTKQTKSFQWENWYPALGGAVTAVVAMVLGDDLVWGIKNKDINIPAFYGAIFNWAAIQAGFAVGIYALVLGSSSEFIAALKPTAAFDRFLQYIERAGSTSFLLAVLTIPFILFEPSPTSRINWAFLGLVSWFSCFSITFLCFVRVAKVFWIIAKVRDRRDIPG